VKEGTRGFASVSATFGLVDPVHLGNPGVHALRDALAPTQGGDAVLARKPSSTMQILSSAAWCFRVARRMSRTSRWDGDVGAEDFWPIFAPSSLR
jgi:hypothetical protein